MGCSVPTSNSTNTKARRTVGSIGMVWSFIIVIFQMCVWKCHIGIWLDSKIVLIMSCHGAENHTAISSGAGLGAGLGAG